MKAFIKSIVFFTSPIFVLIVLVIFLEILRKFFKHFGAKLIYPINNKKISNSLYNSLIIIVINTLKICDNNMNLYYKILYKEVLTDSELNFLNSKLK